MAISDNTTKSLLATYYSTLATYAASHSASPATSGNEVVGSGSSRGLITWGTAANGVIVGTATVVHPTAGSNTLAAVGLWSAATTGTFRDGQYDVADVTQTGPVSFSVTITYTQS